MGSRYRAFLASFFGAVIVTLGSVAAVNWMVDPFHYYRGLTSINRVFFPGFQRYQNVGLARSFRYDTVVIGSSVTENFLPSDIERVWGGKAMKLSISGSTAHEQYLILEQAIRTGQVRRVFWGLDAAAFYDGADRVRDDQAPFPYFMYRDPPVFNVEYPLSLWTLNLSVRVLRGWGETDLNVLDTWYQRFHYGAASVLKDWSGNCAQFAQKYRRGQSGLPPRSIHEMHVSVRQNLLSLVRQNPQITFYLFFPPMSLLIYIPADGGLLDYSLPLRRYLARQTAAAENVRLFDFQTVPALADDLGRYEDMMHFDLATSRYLIAAMRDGRWQVAPRQLLVNNDRLIDEVNGYNLCRANGPLAQRG